MSSTSAAPGIHVRRYIGRPVRVLPPFLERLSYGIWRRATMPGLGVSVWRDGCCIVERGGEKSLRVGGKPPTPPLFFSFFFFLLLEARRAGRQVGRRRDLTMVAGHAASPAHAEGGQNTATGSPFRREMRKGRRRIPDDKNLREKGFLSGN